MPNAAERAPALYIPSLDGIRAIAFLIVFFSHVGPLTSVVPGGFGVTIFFFLSGYLITTLLRLEDQRTGTVSLKQFYLRRVLRILPPMYLALALAIVCSRLVAVHVAANVVAIQAAQLTNYYVALGGAGLPLGTTVLWSLSVEEHFYLVFPVGYLALRRWISLPQRQAAFLFALCWVVLAWRFFVVLRLHGTPAYTMYATDTRLDSILFGCILALWRNPFLPGPQPTARSVWVAFALALPVLLATLIVRSPAFRETVRYTVQGIALAPVFIAAVRFPTALPFRLLNTRFVRWLGVLSYSLYLVHLPFIEVLRRSFAFSESTVAAVALALSIAVAALIHRLVEQPLARVRKRLSRLERGTS